MEEKLGIGLEGMWCSIIIAFMIMKLDMALLVLNHSCNIQSVITFVHPYYMLMFTPSFVLTFFSPSSFNNKIQCFYVFFIKFISTRNKRMLKLATHSIVVVWIRRTWDPNFLLFHNLLFSWFL